MLEMSSVNLYAMRWVANAAEGGHGRGATGMMRMRIPNCAFMQCFVSYMLIFYSLPNTFKLIINLHYQVQTIFDNWLV